MNVRSMTKAVVLVAGLLLGSGARAAEIHGETTRSMLFEFKLSPYTPLIDRDFARPGPYQAIMGGGPMLMGELEFDYQFFQRVGSAAVGFSGGYAEKFGQAVDAETLEPTSQSTGLKLVPLKALLVYRFDWLSLKQDIPIVPYAKLAFVMMPWWVLNGSEIEVSDGLRGAGISYGIAGVFGLALTLDFLDPRLARDLDTSLGVNHSYLFAEFTIQEMGLFVPQSIDLSSRHWMFGLGFEF
ncbi:MAG: MXAN_2562 family outer membrane beta-barrel protein [Myxococcota bacterium]